MRILHLDFHRGWGGQPARILMGSCELARRGCAVAIAAPGEGQLARRAHEAGLEVFGNFGFHKPRRAVALVRDVIVLKRTLAAWRPDIVHSHGSQDTWTTVIANRFGGPRLPHVMTRHNSKRVAWHPANRYLYGKAIDLLVVVSGGVLDRYEEFIRRGVLNRAAVPIIPSSIDFDRYAGPLGGERVRAELGVSRDAPLIGAVGRLVRDKGHQVLLRAFADVLRARPDARLVIAGTGIEQGALRHQAAELGLGASVSFLGFREDIPDITDALDLSVLASLDCDASPAAVKEALYLERPVIVTDIGGLREMVEDGETGLVVPPGDAGALTAAILRLVGDPALRRRLGARGRVIVRERYALGRLADAYERAYRGLLESRRR